jgi:probable rRNA maturation factor
MSTGRAFKSPPSFLGRRVTVVIGRQMGNGIQRGLQRFVARVQKQIGLPGQVTVLLTGNAEMRSLNRRFRKQDKPTDVLSFPPAEGGGGQRLGDVAISITIARGQARRLGHSVEQELKILLLHGLLHLAGYDHEHDQGEMSQAERKFRAKLGLPDSLTERGISRKGVRR